MQVNNLLKLIGIEYFRQFLASLNATKKLYDPFTHFYLNEQQKRAKDQSWADSDIYNIGTYACTTNKLINYHR